MSDPKSIHGPGMKVVLEPTPELYQAPINGAHVPVRIWRGRTLSGTPIKACVLSIIANDEGDADRLQAELPLFMVRSRDLYDIDARSEAEHRAQHINQTGEELPNV